MHERITPSLRKEDVTRQWFVVDAKDKVLGRLATEVARVLRGKHKAVYTPHVDAGDFVIVINAEKVKLTGKRENLKTYFRYSGYPGGATTTSFKEYQLKNPAFIVEHAVKGMVPHTRLGKQIIKKLKVYAGPEHPHTAQKPEVLPL
jgi:large subunit ribosomal protein L13